MVSLFKRKRDTPEDAFDEGWQFYSRATTLEPPGTVFRIDKQGRRYQVGTVAVPTETGAEVAASLEKRIRSTLRAFVRFFGLENLKLSADLGSDEVFRFELRDAVRELITDMALKTSLAAFTKELDYRADNRYFIVREALSATSMTLSLSKELVAKIGGEASLSKELGVGAEATHARDSAVKMPKSFPERMRVAFLPEEIGPTRSNLAGAAPELGLFPVTETLDWEDQ